MADSNDETLLNSTVELNDSYLTAKLPVLLGYQNQHSALILVSTNKEHSTRLVGAHLGRLLYLNHWFLPCLKKSIAQIKQLGFTMVNDQVLKLPEIGYK